MKENDEIDENELEPTPKGQTSNRDDKDLLNLSKTLFTEKEFMKIANEKGYILKSIVERDYVKKELLEDGFVLGQSCPDERFIEKQKVLDFLDWIESYYILKKEDEIEYFKKKKELKL